MQHSNMNLRSADLMQSNNLQCNPHLSHCTQPVLPVLCCRLQHQKHSFTSTQATSFQQNNNYMNDCTCTYFNHTQFLTESCMYFACDSHSISCLWIQLQHSDFIKIFLFAYFLSQNMTLTFDTVHLPELFWNVKFQKPDLFPSPDDSSDRNSFLQQAQPSRELSSLAPDDKHLHFSKHYVRKNLKIVDITKINHVYSSTPRERFKHDYFYSNGDTVNSWQVPQKEVPIIPLCKKQA